MDRQTKLLFLLGASVVAWLLSRTEAGQQVTDTIMSKLPGARGIRNNNPGNIRHSSSKWQGMATTQTDDSFVQFTTPEYGIRAIAAILRNYAKRGVDTIEKVIATWAPATENNTAAYVAAVSKATGIPKGAKLDVANYPALIAAIIKHENGTQPYSMDTINKGVSMS